MNELIKSLKKKHPAEFRKYEQGLLKKNIESVRNGLDVLLSIKGVIPEKKED